MTTPAGRQPGSRAIRLGLRLLTAALAVTLRLARSLGFRARCRHSGPGCEVLLTGMFQSSNWSAAHLQPLSAAQACARVVVVAARNVPPLQGVELHLPSVALVRLLGEAPARLVTFAWLGVRRRPCVVGGFHLLLNGLAAALVARLAGSRALYVCVGGPAELLGGGVDAENRLFARLGTADAAVERNLVACLRGFDLVVTMGSGAARFLRERGVTAPIHVIPGGIDGERFRPADGPADIDVLFVGRLAPIKRVDLLLEALAQAARRIPGIRAGIVGDGDLRRALEEHAARLGLDRVRFEGRQADVAPFLVRARTFVLTSDSEGLPLSVMEAMTCGVPTVASNVGDLSDLVEDGRNGFLVGERCPEAFAERIVALLGDEDLRRRMAKAARASAERYSVAAAQEGWEKALRWAQ